MWCRVKKVGYHTGIAAMEGKEEQWDDDDIIAEYGAFNDTAMGKPKKR